ncbi:MAG: aspartate aminotransferase family protein [Bacteroidales bacterium]|nr:aspartate aminotransferase family protein [Bacteroidales bacterium]MCF8386550.1 aspartate aminotransferase family protein [Bacteroidales bacterium]MCF8397763.1 aspartate aminotransferase family protein [Bacteroidales bacterium]
MTNKENSDLDKKYYLQAFKRYPITLARGQGSHVWDVEGNEYIDALGGIAVNALGHNHPDLVKSLQEQLSRLIHVSNFYLSEAQVKLSEKLVQLSALERVFITNSGAESVEGAIKIARKYAHSIGRGGEVISFTGAFHGRTLASLAATGKKQMQKGFDPMPGGFKQIPFNDIEAARNAISKETAAFIIEPIQGEGGIHLADRDFLHALRKLCNEHNIVLIFDEIQCGMGRTGKMFAHEHTGVKPDIMTLAKALGGGVPMGSILSSEKVSSAIDFGDHGTTFGGNPLACTAGLATLEAIEKEDLLSRAGKKGNWLKNKINTLQLPGFKEFRGKGLMIGVEFEFGTKPLVAKMLEKGVLVNSTADTVLRMLPALNIPQEDLEKVIEVLIESLNELKTHD